MNLPMREIEKAAANEAERLDRTLERRHVEHGVRQLADRGDALEDAGDERAEVGGEADERADHRASAEASASVPLTARLKKSRRPCRRCS